MKFYVLIFGVLLALVNADLQTADDSDVGDDVDYDQEQDYDEDDLTTDIPEPPAFDPDENEPVNSLRLVNVLYRHGDRNPTHTYANDIYDESSWPQGYGQLSKKGMEQEFSLGKYLNKRYVESDFLNPVYQRSEVYVRSTARERTLMSAYCVLAALYPPVDESQSWRENLPWQPIPVHTVPLEEDYLLRTDTSCPVFEAAQEEYSKNNSERNKIMADMENLFIYISDNSGEPNTWDGIYNVLDPIYCQNVSENHRVPDWVTPQVMDSIYRLIDIYSDSFIPPKYVYLRGGTLVGEMLNHMVNRSTHSEETFPMKLFMYSAHDTTLIHFLMTLGVFNQRQPPYTACVMVELHEIQPGEFQVLLLYKNETGEPYPLKLPACDFFCPLETFAQIMKSSIPQNLEKECSLSTQENTELRTFAIISSLEISTIVAITFGSILGFILLFTIICLVKKKFTKVKYEYAPVPIEMN